MAATLITEKGSNDLIAIHGERVVATLWPSPEGEYPWTLREHFGGAVFYFNSVEDARVWVSVYF